MSIVDWKAKFLALFAGQIKKIRIAFTTNGEREVHLRFLERNIDRNSIN